MIERMSQRLLSLTPSGIRRFTAMAKAMPDCAMLTIGEPDFGTPLPIREACKEALDRGETHYPPNVGSLPLREAVAAFEQSLNGYDYSPDEVIMTAGATEAIFVAMQGVLNPGDEVVIPGPAFSLYESIAKLAGAKPVYLDTSPDDFQIKGERLTALVNHNTKLIVLNSPNNPTGSVYTEESLGAVRELVAKRPIFVLCDDVYSRLVYGPCPLFAKYRELREKILVVQSFSKPYSMTGWRLGYLMGDRPVMEKLTLYHAAAVVSIAAYAQSACITALAQDISPMAETYRARRDYIYGRIRDMGLKAVKPMGAFYIFPSIEAFGMGSEDFCMRMIREGRLAAVPGACFGADKFIRFSYCYSLEEIERGMDRLEGFIQSLR